jgi:hypothetical protein
MVGESIKAWLRRIWEERTTGNRIAFQMSFARNATELQQIYDGLTPDQKEWSEIKTTYPLVKAIFAGQEAVTELAEKEILDALTALQVKSESFRPKTPDEAKKQLAGLTKEVFEIAAGVSAAEMITAKSRVVPSDTLGGIYHRTLTWLGFGAVLAAVAHDPVKIGFLRPYQDNLEAAFRNRRPDDFALFQAYRTRELSPKKIEDLSKLDDTLMDAIEAENQTYYDTEIAKWGYSEWFAGALARSATRTLNFSQLVTLARAGIYDRGLYIYSLWGEGLDRVVMKPALQALETLRDREMYSGFRSMIEPSYVDGQISEQDLLEYWKLSGVPDKVRDWVLPRLRARRQAALAKEKGATIVKERDLTLSQIQTAYVDGIIDRTRAQNMIAKMGYSTDETTILLDLAEARIKAPATGKLKRLPLGDYEKAQKAKLITLQDVLQRMEGEYTKEDIALEKKLLEAGKA